MALRPGPQKKDETTHSTSGGDLLEFIFRDRMEHLGLMSSALVHELHTPLIIIRGRVESLLRHPGQNVAAGLKEISQECQHLLRLLEAMTFVAPSAEPFRFQNLSLKSIVDDVLVFFEKPCLEKNISLVSEVPSHLRIDSESNRLKSILMSLINNAVDSFQNAPPNSVKNILIHTQIDTEFLHLVISDTGCGMTQLVQRRLLKDLFFSTKVNQQASGLGLSLAQKMAEDLKVTMSFVSQEGHGTSFTLSFPLNIRVLDPR